MVYYTITMVQCKKKGGQEKGGTIPFTATDLIPEGRRCRGIEGVSIRTGDCDCNSLQ
jgi:hypothetical protein